MKFCQSHWDELKKAIDERGLSKFVSKGGAAVVEKLKNELEDGQSKQTFDPLMGAHNAIAGHAIEMGGIYLLGDDYCPICESEKHGGPNADWFISNAANEQADRAKQYGLT